MPSDTPSLYSIIRIFRHRRVIGVFGFPCQYTTILHHTQLYKRIDSIKIFINIAVPQGPNGQHYRLLLKVWNERFQCHSQRENDDNACRHAAHGRSQTPGGVWFAGRRSQITLHRFCRQMQQNRRQYKKQNKSQSFGQRLTIPCLLYTSDAADE